ncbi:hypothetical protein [Sphingobacterium composti Ten et al. 2007 non Yoo et al. 2007]|nr:hypothetical protein [Sphingobacterium composti Ten et al. 2007 non Yoo et al. 2007]
MKQTIRLKKLANPNDNVDPSGLPFFLRARNGIEQLIDWANRPYEE